MGDDIRYREPETRADHVLESDRRIPLYHLRRNAEKQLSVKLPGINNTWYDTYIMDWSSILLIPVL